MRAGGALNHGREMWCIKPWSRNANALQFFIPYYTMGNSECLGVPCPVPLI